MNFIRWSVFLVCVADVAIGQYTVAGALAAVYIVIDLIFSPDHGGL